MGKKYKLTEESALPSNVKLFRIESLIEFTTATGVIVRVGEKGGYVSSEKNLAQDGMSWVSGNAKVWGNAKVSGNAEVSGNAKVWGNAKVSGNAEVSGNAKVWGDAEVSKKCICIDFAVNWVITITDNHIKIGCQQHLIAEWHAFSDNEIAEMDSNALVWWKKWKGFIFQAIELSK